jgi:glutamyl-tRNA synthetase
VGRFRIEDISGVQASFDTQELMWMNGEYIMKIKMEELLPLIRKRFIAAEIKSSALEDGYILKLIEVYKVKIKTLNELAGPTDYFFGDDFTMDEKGKKKCLDKEENWDNVPIFTDRLEDLNDFSGQNIEKACRAIAEEEELKAAGIIHPTRMAISGKMKGAGLFEIMKVLGKERVIERMERAAA